MELMPMIHCAYMIVSTLILGGLTLLDFINAKLLDSINEEVD